MYRKSQKFFGMAILGIQWKSKKREGISFRPIKLKINKKLKINEKLKINKKLYINKTCEKC